MTTEIIEVDGDRHTRLPGHHNRYRVHEASDGRLVLDPEPDTAELERRFFANTELQAQIAEANAHPERRRPRPERPTEPVD